MSEADPIRFGPSPSPAEAQEPTPAPAWAYLLRCPDGSLYGGWTNDLARRVKAHQRHLAQRMAQDLHLGAGPAKMPATAARAADVHRPCNAPSCRGYSLCGAG